MILDRWAVREPDVSEQSGSGGINKLKAGVTGGLKTDFKMKSGMAKKLTEKFSQPCKSYLGSGSNVHYSNYFKGKNLCWFQK